MIESRDPVDGERSRPPGRLPYEKPAVSWESPLETQPSLMAGCAKISGSDPSCGGVGPDPVAS